MLEAMGQKPLEFRVLIHDMHEVRALKTDRPLPRARDSQNGVRSRGGPVSHHRLIDAREPVAALGPRLVVIGEGLAARLAFL